MLLAMISLRAFHQRLNCRQFESSDGTLSTLGVHEWACSAEENVVPARGKCLVKTDLAIAVPEGCYGRVGASVYFE